MKPSLLLILLMFGSACFAGTKKIALTFDDAPIGDSAHFRSEARSMELIRQLRRHGVREAMVFANPCSGRDRAATLAQLSRYRDAGHLIGNHTCSHPRLDDVGFEAYAEDARQADVLLAPLMAGGTKFFGTGPLVCRSVVDDPI